MSLPFFYINSLDNTATSFVLNEDTSRHVVQVLRMQLGEQLLLTDGKGHVITAMISDDHKKRCVVQQLSASFIPPAEKKITIAISLLKNAARFEWFLEKATEIGVTEIIPLLCARTAKEHFRTERMNGILVSAMLQSKQAWLPLLHEPVAISRYFQQSASNQDQIRKFIAHCEEDAIKTSLTSVSQKSTSVILIGPEGDFTQEEINHAIVQGYTPVSLGDTRLRTETAGIVAAVQLKG